MPETDINIEIDFNINEPDKTTIRTNAKKKAIRGILESWLFCQRGQDEDESEPREKSEYKIKIQLDLSDDTFYTQGDTGNKELTRGIVWEVFKRLDKIEVLSFSWG